MQFARYFLPLVVACTAAAATSSRSTQSSPEAFAGDLDRARALVAESGAARASSDHFAARAQASEAAALLLAQPESAQDTAWLALLESAGHAAADAQDPGTASSIWRRVVDCRTSTLPAQVLELQRARNNLAIALLTLGDLTGARSQLERAVEAYEPLLAADDIRLQTARMNLATTLAALGDLRGAKALHEKVLAVFERTLHADDPHLQDARTNLGKTLLELGDIAGAHALFEKVFAVHSRMLPDDHPSLQLARHNLAATLATLGDHARAKILIEKELEVDTRMLPEDHPDLQLTRRQYAAILKVLGDYAGALEVEERVLELQSRLLPEDHPDLRLTQIGVAQSLAELGDLEAARSLEERVFEICSRTLPEDHLDLQHVRNNLASTLGRLGDHARARVLQEETLDICSRTLPDDHPLLQSARENLALTFGNAGDHTGARDLKQRVLDVRSRAFPEDHIDLQRARTNLACTLLDLGDVRAARTMFEAVLEIYSRTLPPAHPKTQLARMNVAVTIRDLGEFAAARALLEDALGGFSRSLPDGDSLLQTARESLATTIAKQVARTRHASGAAAGRHAEERQRCAALLGALCRADVRTAREAICGSPSRETEERCIDLDPHLDVALSFASGIGSIEPLTELEADVFALSETTRGAGLVSAQFAHTAAESPQYGELRRELRQASSALAELAHTGATSDEFDRARAQREAVERELIAQAREYFGAQLGGAEFDVDSFAARLPEHTAAIGFRRYERARIGVEDALDATGQPAVRATAVASLCAFVVRSAEERLVATSPLTLVDLGSIEPVEVAVRAWREAIGVTVDRGMAAGDSQDDVVAERGETLRRLVFDPLLPALGTAHRLVVAFDDVLHLVPLDALPWTEAEAGSSARTHVGDHWRIEPRATLTELLTDSPAPTGAALLAIGGASFNTAPVALSAEEIAALEHAASIAHGAPASVEGPVAEARVEPARVAALLRGTAWERGFAPLTHTAEEARGIGALYEEIYEQSRPVLVLEKRTASRANLGELAPRARFLHVATHGWFAPDSIASWSDPEPLDKLSGLGTRQSRAERVKGMSPMLLCGLALAGANLPESARGRAPGLMTADELSTLDLSNCELAVLSACDTNAGEQRAGQGVASLQRALQMAGARSVITSLWKVPDEATKELMLDFYRRLWVEQKPKWQALWEAKTRLRGAQDERGQPKYATRDWAAWVLTGAPD